MRQWRRTAIGESVTFEMRWKKKPIKEHGNEDDTRDYLWTLTTCAPIKSDKGIVRGVFGCNTDISAQKEATRAAILRMEAEKRLASFTELAPVGLYHLDATLKITYCNDQWFRITNHNKVPVDQIDWESIILQEDLESIHRNIQRISRKKGLHSFEFRLKKPWRGPDGASTPTWLLATATTQLDMDGDLTSMVGTMTDISQLKWAEAVQKDRFEEALESKRQQENFIDITSHEMVLTTPYKLFAR
jgi:PAS domain S-box-containing protein